MSEVRVGYVVQDLESYMFLCEQDGDVGYTPCLHAAGTFPTWEEAFETGRMVLLERLVCVGTIQAYLCYEA
ncbi:hypothetical protein [Undibacterium sp. CY21W]|jgi:hypothetical protein|uniref:hypothetical protein n=1 Tax=Undibacterium sp. CY21W TaxID=2762293 RepID=UPI00164A16CA|nr:hypothetical protein [Undibacterium sp. CY21W]MBC3928465.1 hypothetical protein [Undibacterium sp. CY21W]